MDARHERHPLLVEDITSADTGCDVSTNGVSEILGSVGVELSSVICEENMWRGDQRRGDAAGRENREGGLGSPP